MTFEKEISFFGKECLIHDLEWYEQSFRPQKGQETPQIRGDISPWYARLTRQSVRAVHRVVPDAQIILFIRNPIERAWSHALMELGRNPKRDLARVTQWRWIAHFDRLRQWLYGDYERTLKNWSAFFPQRQIQVDLYERVSSDPAGLMRDVLTHVGADPDWTPPQSLTQKIWTISEATNGRAEGIQLPDSLRWHLAKQWLEPTQRLNDRLEGQVNHWVRQMQDITARPAPLSWRTLRTVHRTMFRWPKRAAFGAFHLAREAKLAKAYRRIAIQVDQRRSIAPSPSPILSGRELFSGSVQKDRAAAQKV